MYVGFDYVVTVCGRANEQGSSFSGQIKIIHARFDDPPKLAAGLDYDEAKLDCYRRVRDEIENKLFCFPLKEE